jgi:hypothetical protein
MKNHERSLLAKMGADHPSFLLAIYRQNEKFNLKIFFFKGFHCQK